MKWRRGLAVGCSHGKYLDSKAAAAVLRFRAIWKPDVVLHLGDWADTTAFRGGAAGTCDETEPVRPDIESGLQFLEELDCTHAFDGNHEHRITRLMHHPNALISEAAQSVDDRINERLRKIRCQRIPYKPTTPDGYRRFGDFLFGHGFLFNEMCCRDHAEALGNIVFAHAHRTGMARGRTLKSALGVCVGTLCRRAEMDYASQRRSTLAWSAGFCWFEYNEDKAQIWLHENDQREEWRLPI